MRAVLIGFATCLLFFTGTARAQKPAPVPALPDKPAFVLPTEEPEEETPDEARKPAAGQPTTRPLRAPPAQGVMGEKPVTDGATVQGLDKISAKITRLDLVLDRPVMFGTLRITARACAMRPPEEPPESTAFLEIDDLRGNPQGRRVFSGWMFASTPALSALEHPVYDVWVTSCRISSASSGGSRKKSP